MHAQRSGKVLADVLEAVVGVFLVQRGPESAADLLHALGILKRPAWGWSEQGCAAEPGSESDPTTLDERVDVGSLETILGYNFKSPGLAAEAVTHCSWAGQSSFCYQRLEFLGDAVLDYVITRHCFDSFRHAAWREEVLCVLFVAGIGSCHFHVLPGNGAP